MSVCLSAFVWRSAELHIFSSQQFLKIIQQIFPLLNLWSRWYSNFSMWLILKLFNVLGCRTAESSVTCKIGQGCLMEYEKRISRNHVTVRGDSKIPFHLITGNIFQASKLFSTRKNIWSFGSHHHMHMHPGWYTTDLTLNKHYCWYCKTLFIFSEVQVSSCFF